jgi:hypothetical protein
MKKKITCKKKNIQLKSNKQKVSKRIKKNIQHKTVNKVQRGGEEVTKEMKKQINNLTAKSKPELNKLPTEMSEEEFRHYQQMQNNAQIEASSYRDPFVHEYMFSPLLSEQMKSETDAVAGSYFVGVNPLKFYDQFKKMVTGKRDKTAMNNTLSSLGNWVDKDKTYTQNQIKEMGYRNDSGLVLKVEDYITKDSSFKDIILESKKYSSISKQGKITPLGLIKMVRLLDRFKKEESQWLRTATVLEIIFENLGIKNTRANYFKSERIIPEHFLFEIEEFFNTNHLFMTLDEIRKFKDKLSFYRLGNDKVSNRIKKITSSLRENSD